MTTTTPRTGLATLWSRLAGGRSVPRLRGGPQGSVALTTRAGALASRDAALAAERGRRLGLVAGEVEGRGLALLGLAERLEGGSRDRAVPAAMRAEAERLLRLSDDARDQLAAEAGDRRLREEPLPVAELVEAALAEVRRPLGADARRWRLDPALGTLTVLGDRRALTRAVATVLARAARETRAGDQIAVRARRDPHALALVVEDEGEGQGAADLGAHGPLSGHPGTRGLALGLATARDLLRAHGGDLALEATPGVGSRAWLTLPLGRVLRDGAEQTRPPAGTDGAAVGPASPRAVAALAAPASAPVAADAR